MAKIINISKDFSAFPAGRVPDDGKFNGHDFRVNVLLPELTKALEDKTYVVVDLDGLKSCGSSFLDSAFGGLIRYEKFSKPDLMKYLKIKFSDPSLERYKVAIDRYISRAVPESRH